MDLWAWATIAAVCATGAMSPGPSLAVVVRNTVRLGRRGGIACGLGHGLGVGIYAFGAVVGFSALIAAVPGLARAMAIGGGLFLILLGVQSLRPPGEEPVAAHGVGGGGFREGFLTAFLNPKIAVFFLALLGAFLPDDSSLGTRAGVAGLAMSIDAGWYCLVAAVLAGSGGAAWLAHQGRTLDIGMGVLLVGVGVVVLVG